MGQRDFMLAQRGVELAGAGQRSRPGSGAALHGTDLCIRGMPRHERAGRIAALVAAHAAGDKKTYVTSATALAQDFGQDASIMFLIERLNETEKGESYVLS